jgi:hypothetical protein
VAKHHKHAKHAHRNEGFPWSKLRRLAVPIALFFILIYAAQYAVRSRDPKQNVAVGILIAAIAAILWILQPRKNRHDPL